MIYDEKAEVILKLAGIEIPSWIKTYGGPICLESACRVRKNLILLDASSVSLIDEEISFVCANHYDKALKIWGYKDFE